MIKPLFRSAAVFLTLATAHGWALTFESIYSFPADKSQGQYPTAALTAGSDGNLYGTATKGGTDDSGTAFKITTSGVFSVLGHFERSTTGYSPSARLLNVGDGFLYGVTERNSETVGVTYGGTVFKLNPEGGLSVVFNLPGGGNGPKVPKALVSGEPNVLHVLGSDPAGIWRVPLNGETRTIASQLALSGDEGLSANSLVRGADGRLYGTTAGNTYSEGLPNRQGTIFRTDGDGSNFASLFEFHYTQSGAAPKSAMARDSDGVFYGVTYAGGQFGDGCFYRFDPSSVTPGVPNSGFTLLKNLDDVPSSEGDLLIASDGKIYGTSRAGYGYVWRINKDGSGFQRIHQFTGTNGADPAGGLVQAADGFLYGTTRAGGTGSNGTIYRIDLGLPMPVANRPPVAIRDFKNSSGSAVNINVLANDFDADGDAVTVSIESQPIYGTLEIEEDGSITYFVTPGGGYSGYDEFRYRITDPDGLFSTALVSITDQPIASSWQPGVYNGILNLDPLLAGSQDVPRGQLVINVLPTGVFTGKLFTGKKGMTVRGFFTDDGIAIATVKTSKKGRAVIFLGSGQGEALTALFFGKETWSGFISPMAQPPGVAASYTMQMEGGPDLPQAQGFAAMKIRSNGVVAAIGKLPDGSTVTWGTTCVSVGGETFLPVFCEPIKGGALAGYLGASAPGNLDAFLGQSRWIRPPNTKRGALFPAGFSGDLSISIYPFTPAARGTLPLDFGLDQTGAVFAFDGAAVDVGGTLTVKGSRLVPSAPFKALSINRKTGIFTGKFKLGGKTVKVQGAVLQPLQVGFGLFIFNKVPGTVVLSTE